MSLKEAEIKQELKRFLGDAPILYLKHVREEKWAKDLHDGKLFMNPVKFFRDLEEKTGKRGQGDKNELIQRIEITKGKIINHDTNETFLEFSSANAKLEIEGDKDYFLYCVSGITIDDLELLETDESSVTFKLPFNEQTIDNLKKNFGEHVVIISGPDFRKLIDGLTVDEQVKAIFGKVEYVRPNALQKMEAFNIFSAKRFLYKDIDLEYQKEYRLAVDKTFVRNSHLDIGPIKDISHVCKIDDLSNYALSYTVAWEKK